MNKIIISIVLCFSILACTSQKKITYEFPSAMAANIRMQYAERCDKGKGLYAKNCARCHNTKVNGKTIIPDFNEEKLQGYSIRVANARHETSMPDSLVTEEELILISTFLTYKKKNNS